MLEAKEAPTTTGSLEVRRIKAAARAKLFGESAAPPQISRYRVLRQLGVGGMGEVYLAHDDGLGRKVAIKLVRLDRERGVERASSRLMREAQALARLSHPNVVQVYEVGEFEGRVFIAMEFVQGVHMRRWIEGGERPWRQILELYAQAGAGLAAAHRVGLVHRDFKPENVLVGSDGRVRVVDFGLVRKAPDPDSDPALSDNASAEDLERSSRLTQSGVLMGTPSYMSPEQFQGLRATEKSDQFAFCVALYRGLYGWHPFAAETRLELKRRVLSGQLAVPPRDTKVPHGIFEVLERGLAVDPDGRYPSMEALLAALAKPPRRRRVGLVASTGAAALAGGLVAWFTWPFGADALTAGGQTWNPARQATIEAAFHDTGAPYATAAAAHVAERVAALAADLDAARAAPRLRDDALEVRRLACLERREGRLAALVDALELADLTLVERAPELADTLLPIDTCATRLADGPAPPTPAALAPAPAARDALGRGRVAALRRRWDEASRAAGEAEEAANRIGAGALQAEALALRGHASLGRGSYAHAYDQLHDALDLAELHHHDELLVEIWLDLADAARLAGRSPEVTLLAAERAAAAAARAGDPAGSARAAWREAMALRAMNQPLKAEAALQAALGHAEKMPALAAALELELGQLLRAALHPEARSRIARARDLAGEFPGHPLLAAADAALEELERARTP